MHHDYSPSQLAKIRECPSCVKMSKLFPRKQIEDKTRDMGTRIHEALQYSNPEILESNNERELYDKAVQYVNSFNLTKTQEELLLYIKDNKDEVLTFGTIDKMGIAPDGTYVAIDYKFGFNAVDEAAENLQLAAYALAIMQTYNVEQVKVCICQPPINHYSSYTFTDKHALYDVVYSIIQKAKSPGFTLKTNKYCQYCSAIENCPEAIGYVIKATDNTVILPEVVEEYYDKCKMLESFIKAIKSKAMEVAQSNGGRLGKYAVVQSKGDRSIKDVNEFYNVPDISNILEPNHILSACTITYGKAEELYVLARQKQLESKGEKMSKDNIKREFEKILTDAHVLERSKPSVSLKEKPA